MSLTFFFLFDKLDVAPEAYEDFDEKKIEER